MKFSSMQLIIDDEFPDQSLFETLNSIGASTFRKGKYLHTVEHYFSDDKKYYWFYFQFDNENLYTETVVDTTDNSFRSNPRPKNQVEMRYQLFACYDLSRHLLYISDYQKKNTVTDYIEHMLQKPTVVKNVYKSIDEFASMVKFMKSVTFMQRRSLYTLSPDSIFQKQINLYGLDLPERSKIKLDYGLSPIGIVKTTLQSWNTGRENGEFDEIVIVGIDDSGLESSFNFSTMISMVEIDLKKDDNDRYDPDLVRILLMTKLGK